MAEKTTPVLTLFTPTQSDPDMRVSEKLTLPVLKDKNAGKTATSPAGKDKSKKPTDPSKPDSLLDDE